MEERLVTAIIACVSAIAGGVISGVVSPFVKHLIEQSAAKSARQREQIAKWREMLLGVNHRAEGNISPGPILHLHPEFITLEPHLTVESRRIARADNRTVVVGQALCVPLETLKNEIARIEKEWGLQN